MLGCIWILQFLLSSNLDILAIDRHIMVDCADCRSSVGPVTGGIVVVTIAVATVAVVVVIAVIAAIVVDCTRA